MWSGLGKEWDGAGRWGAQKDSQHPVVAQGSVQTPSLRASHFPRGMCRQEKWIPSSLSLPVLLGGCCSSICARGRGFAGRRRRSRRWADEITEAKAGREWIPTPQIFSIVFSVTELGKIEHHWNGAEPALPCALGNRSQKLPIYISSAAASLNPRTDTG